MVCSQVLQYNRYIHCPAAVPYIAIAITIFVFVLPHCHCCYHSFYLVSSPLSLLPLCLLLLCGHCHGAGSCCSHDHGCCWSSYGRCHHNNQAATVRIRVRADGEGQGGRVGWKVIEEGSMGRETAEENEGDRWGNTTMVWKKITPAKNSQVENRTRCHSNQKKVMMKYISQYTTSANVTALSWTLWVVIQLCTVGELTQKNTSRNALLLISPSMGSCFPLPLCALVLLSLFLTTPPHIIHHDQCTSFSSSSKPPFATLPQSNC